MLCRGVVVFISAEGGREGEREGGSQGLRVSYLEGWVGVEDGSVSVFIGDGVLERRVSAVTDDGWSVGGHDEGLGEVDGVWMLDDDAVDGTAVSSLW